MLAQRLFPLLFVSKMPIERLPPPSLLCPFSGHVLICGMNESIGLLLRALLAPPPLPPRAAAHSPGYAGDLTARVAAMVARGGGRFGPAVLAAGKAGVGAQPALRRSGSAGSTGGGGGAEAALPSHAAHAVERGHVPIVILCPPERPSDATMNAMHPGTSRLLSRAHMVTGTPSDLMDLMRAGVESARAVVMLSTKKIGANPDGNDNLADDTDVIVTASAVYKLNPRVHIVSEVLHGQHASYLRPCGSNLLDAEDESTDFLASIRQAAAAKARVEARNAKAKAGGGGGAGGGGWLALGLQVGGGGGWGGKLWWWPLRPLPPAASHAALGRLGRAVAQLQLRLLLRLLRRQLRRLRQRLRLLPLRAQL